MSGLSDFVEGYAKRSNLSVADLYLRNYRAYPCSCDDDDCQGFQMLQGDARADYELAEMLGKSVVELSVDELKLAHAVANAWRNATGRLESERR